MKLDSRSFANSEISLLRLTKAVSIFFISEEISSVLRKNTDGETSKYSQINKNSFREGDILPEDMPLI